MDSAKLCIIPTCLTIKDWPQGERPREKLLKHGPRLLCDSELLAILIGSGTRGATAVDLAQTLLHEYEGLSGIAQKTIPTLCRVKGIGEVSAARMASAMEISRRLAAGDYSDRPKLTTPEQVAGFFGPSLRDLKQEVFKVILLDGGNRLLRDVDVTQGILNASLVHPREVFKYAVDHQAAAVILVHNHPSGEQQPSIEDKQVTQQMVSAGKILGIPVLDHIIITRLHHFSFAQNGMI